MGRIRPLLCWVLRSGELLPASELLLASDNQLTPASGGIKWGDVMVDDARTPSMLKVHLRVSKCDQFGKGVDVFVGKSNTLRCPVVAVVAYMAARGQRPGPFFLRQPDKPLTKLHFVAEVRKALTVAGLNQTAFAGHSF